MLVRALAAGGLTAFVAATALAQSGSTKPTVVTDEKDAVDGAVDLRRVSLARGSDGRLRASVSAFANWDGATLRTRSGPPGSLCLRLWTTSDPPDEPPDYLVCVTAKARGAGLQASVLRERANQLPERVAAAVVSRPSKTGVVLRFAQSAVGRPAQIDFSGESTKAGCTRVRCVDTAPNAPKVARLRLRKPASTGT